MSPISDIVKLSKLETVLHCDPDYTQHFECPDGDCSERRPVRTEERWKRKRRLGQGGYGTVYLEQCFQGNNMGKLRAVKEIPKKGSGDYNRELEAIALLSTIKVSLIPLRHLSYFHNGRLSSRRRIFSTSSVSSSFQAGTRTRMTYFSPWNTFHLAIYINT